MTKPTIRKIEGPVRLPLSKVVPEYHFHLSWDVRPDASDVNRDFDLDAVAFLLGANGKVAQNSSENMVFYNTHLLSRAGQQNMSADGSTELSGDNRRGGEEGEVIKVRVPRIAPSVQKIILATTIYDAGNRRQTFGKVNNASVEILSVTVAGLVHSEGSYDLTHESPNDTGLVFGELVRESLDWQFNPLSRGYAGGLREIGGLYGIEFSD